jgi:hypothetical protein
MVTPLIPIIKTAIIIVAVIIVCLTFVSSLDKILHFLDNNNCKTFFPILPSNEENLCKENSFFSIVDNLVIPQNINNTNQILDLSMISNIDNFTSNNLSKNSELFDKNITLRSLVGIWSILGYNMGKPTSANILFKNNQFYEIKGLFVDKDGNHIYYNNGIFKIDKDHSILQLSRNDGIQLAYILNSIEKGSFNAYNPNTMEYYKFNRLK